MNTPGNDPLNDATIVRPWQPAAATPAAPIARTTRDLAILTG